MLPDRTNLFKTFYHGKGSKSTRIFPSKIVGLSKQPSCNHARTVLCFASQARQSPPVRSLLTLTKITRFCQNATNQKSYTSDPLRMQQPHTKFSSSGQTTQTNVSRPPSRNVPTACELQPLAVSRGRGLARTLM